jgi:hypothetical protein
MELGSVRVEGVLNVTDNGNPFGQRDGTDTTQSSIFIDEFCGAGAFIEQISTSLGGSMLESIMDYPRYVKMAKTAMSSQTDMFNAANVCELRAPAKEFVRLALQGQQVPDDPGSNANRDILRQAPDFSVKPMCVLNEAVGSLPYRKSGDVRLSLNLARAGAMLFGNAAGDASYTLSELRVFFRSTPDMGPETDQPLTMRRIISSKQVYSGQSATLQTRVPAECAGVSISFLDISKENEPTANTLDLDKVDGLNEVQYLFNDSTNQLITYRLRSQVEWIGRYLESIRDPRTGTNAATLSNLASNVSWGLGLDFGGMVDLSNQNFAIELERDSASSTTQYLVYFYFNSIIQL